MTSRERVWAALAHKEPDKIPLDLGGSMATSINAIAYQRLKKYLGFADSRSRVTQIILFLSEVEEEIRRKWGIDVISLDRYEAAPGIPLTGEWIEHLLPNGDPAFFPKGFSPVINSQGNWELYHQGIKTSVLSPQTSVFVPAYFPLENADLRQLKEFEPAAISDAELEFLHRRAKDLYENTEYAVFGFFYGSIFEAAQFLCGYENFMYRLAAEKDFARLLLEKLTDRVIADLTLYLDAVGDCIDIIGFADDVGIQTGPQISPALFRELIKPCLAKIFKTSHRLSQAYVFFHSCGSVYEFMNDFIEIGVDVLNPVQTSAFMMEPERLKKEFGNRLSFWGGGCDVQNILPFGTPADIRKDVRRRLEIFSQGGGYVFAPIHDIQPDVPPANIEAMFEEAKNFSYR
ncbi:MAG: uroporphyrinogen decarboxylase family protein [Spirochaetota bacterium]